MRPVAIDTETWLIGPGRLAPTLVCLSYHDGTSGGVLHRDDGIAYFRELVADEDVLLVGHNIAFDLGVLVQQAPDLMEAVWEMYDQGRIFDTQIYETMRKIAYGWYRIDPRTSKPPRYSLGALAREYLHISMVGKMEEGAWRFRYRELDAVPVEQWPEEAYEYAANDAVYTFQVYERQIARWAKEAEKRSFPQELPNRHEQFKYAWSMHLMSAWGVRTDPEAVTSLKNILQETVDRAMSTLMDHGVYRKHNGTKNLSVIRERVTAAYEARGVSPPLTSKGAVSTSAATLRESKDDVLLLLASIAESQKLLNTFIPILETGTERPINPRFNPLVASGRSSCRNPNLQNQPRRKGVRDCYIPREGFVFAACDYHIAELCALAQILVSMFDSSNMAEAIQEGRDLHIETAAGILGMPYEAAYHRYLDGDAEVKTARQLAKAANFGFPGGLGASSFVSFAKASYGLEITEDESVELKNAWLSRYPEMVRYFQFIADSCRKQGDSFTYTQPVSGRIRGAVGFCDGCNTGFQGLTADGAKAALHEVIRECYLDKGTALFGCRPIAFIHDEIILEVPEDGAPEAALRLEEVMVDIMSEYMPDIPVKADAHLMRRWYKSAEPVHNADGVLIPWEPEV